MQPPPPHRILTLQDGRRLSDFDIGPTDAPAVVFFHGYPGSRLQARLLERGARRVGVRLVGFDRAGMGWSDPRGGVTLFEATDDVAELADHLELRRFAVLGWSGGGPFASACAVFRYPHYHQATDTPEKLDYVRLAALVGATAGWIGWAAGRA